MKAEEVQVRDEPVAMVAVLRRHFDPALQMLAQIIESCPESLWAAQTDGGPLWQHVMHALIGVQFWFREASERFAPPDFGKGPVPDLGTAPSFDVEKGPTTAYLQHIQSRAEAFFGSLDDGRLHSGSSIYEKCTYADLILGQTRHIQHHVGYCNRILRDGGRPAAKWLGYGE
jgi:hypothetical protein